MEIDNVGLVESNRIDLGQYQINCAMNLAKKYSKEANISTMGSEYLILAMYETEDSLCHFLLSLSLH